MFQTLDEKGSCVGIYKNGELYFSNYPDDLDRTWNYVDFLKGQNIDYAQLYCEGSSLENACPDYLKHSLKEINLRLKAFLNSFKESKISLKENCFFDLVPKRFLKEICILKDKISEHVFDSYEKPKEYIFFKEFTEFLADISRKDLNLDKNLLSTKLYNPQAKKLFDKINEGHIQVKYNMFSSITGRLTVSDKSFPILNLNSKFRDVIKPTNDWFVSFDLNAAEMRIALALAGQVQPEGDLHEIVRKEVFGEDVTRTFAKNVSTQWLYGAYNNDVIKYDLKLNEFYNKQSLVSNFWKNGQVLTPFNRKIESDVHHIISYLCQSTLIDMFHRQIINIYKKLENKQSFIPFMIHDQVILDLKDSEKSILPEIISALSDTQFGKFPVKVEIGTNFGNMKIINIKV